MTICKMATTELANVVGKLDETIQAYTPKAQAASKMTDFKVYPIDSKIGSFPMVKMIEIGNELFADGKDVRDDFGS